MQEADSVISQYTGTSPFLQTSRKIYEFVKDNSNDPQSAERIVYVAGTFDLFHVGHLDFLEKAKSFGDYLIVGLHSDYLMVDLHSYNPFAMSRSIMTLNERTMNLLSYKCVDEVVIDAPRIVTTDFMEHFNVSMVCHGRFVDASLGFEPYEVPKKMNKFSVIDSGSDVTTDVIIERIRKNDAEYRATNRSKEESESQYH